MAQEILLSYSKREDVGNRQGLKWLEQMALNAFKRIETEMPQSDMKGHVLDELRNFINAIKATLQFGYVNIKEEPTDSSPSTNYPRSWGR